MVLLIAIAPALVPAIIKFSYQYRSFKIWNKSVPPHIVLSRSWLPPVNITPSQLRRRSAYSGTKQSCLFRMCIRFTWWQPSRAKASIYPAPTSAGIIEAVVTTSIFESFPFVSERMRCRIPNSKKFKDLKLTALSGSVPLSTLPPMATSFPFGTSSFTVQKKVSISKL